MSAKALLALLATYADRDGRCFPSRERLALELATSQRTVARLLAELVKAGVVARTQPGKRSVALTRIIGWGDTSGTPGVTPVAHRTRPSNNTKNKEPSLPWFGRVPGSVSDDELSVWCRDARFTSEALDYFVFESSNKDAAPFTQVNG